MQPPDSETTAAAARNASGAVEFFKMFGTTAFFAALLGWVNWLTGRKDRRTERTGAVGVAEVQRDAGRDNFLHATATSERAERLEAQAGRRDADRLHAVAAAELAAERILRSALEVRYEAQEREHAQVLDRIRRHVVDVETANRLLLEVVKAIRDDDLPAKPGPSHSDPATT